MGAEDEAFMEAEEEDGFLGVGDAFVLQSEEEDELLGRISASGSHAGYDSEESGRTEYELWDLSSLPALKGSLEWPQLLLPNWNRRSRGHRRRRGCASSLFCLHPPKRRGSLHHHVRRFVKLFIKLFIYTIIILVIFTGVFFPSYSYPPQRYIDLRRRVAEEGGANINNEKVYITATLYDHEGELLSGDWARSVLYLIDILGPDNVFLSIYENNPDAKAQVALDAFIQKVTCAHEILAEDVDLADYPHVTTPDGQSHPKRIAFLADLRNRALRPLENETSWAYTTRFDKLLYLNDVIFDPVDAANLLFSTNVDEASGRSQYHAACAVDFINPFKFYDTFATRDLEGYDMGVPFYPWFSGAGQAASRKDVINQKEAVRVKSCWGGMVAFEAKWFQPRQWSVMANSSLRFRSETDSYWDASECCLIHADLAAISSPILPEDSGGDTGIYLNPYIRTAYSSSVLRWLSFTRRFERLYTPIQTLANWLAGRPSFNSRQFHESGHQVVDRVWMWDDDSLAKLKKAGNKSVATDLQGHFEEVQRTALPGGFCGIQKLLYINENPKPGEPKWDSFSTGPINVTASR